MKSKKSYNKILILFFIVVALVLMTGCDGGVGFGSIEVNSTPSGARVYLDGADTGQVTPIVLNASAGDHTVKLSKYHYKDWADVVTVITEQTTYLNPPLIWAPDETITIQPGSIDGKDAYVDNEYPTSCYGNSKDLYVKAGCLNPIHTFYGISRSYLQFDLSSLQEQCAVIISAYLSLFHYYSYWACSASSSLCDHKLSIGVYAVTESWGEYTITWNNQPASSTVAEDIIIEPWVAGDYEYWDIADLVKGWCEEGITNYGIVLRATDETPPLVITADSRTFYSSDYGTEIDRPKLVIDYYIP